MLTYTTCNGLYDVRQKSVDIHANDTTQHELRNETKD